ncbi:hypothetical protein LNTAR_12591 [Lentisphaera araneosa HTCC2155]|jgi:hypothetical protein|uniref:Uncharacterized protein n=1 Tax=Lentisphaera araneosa HTCC2155 TaxID=313628 RepID=A6DJW9_9BACT|nr:hypothetical protein [Lentisphaera araneosa]EDM28193.1 hypothetical protein LNTAR_12591 [Lentisphaera araneosa HTCC2155]
MNKLSLILFSTALFFSCVNKPEVEDLGSDALLLKQDALKIVYHKTEGSYIGKAIFDDELAFDYLQESFPSTAQNFRSRNGSDIHDKESIISRTFLPHPSLNVNRSFALKENALELNWRFKNTSEKAITGKFQINMKIDKNAKVRGKNDGTEITLYNGLKLNFIHGSHLSFTPSTEGLKISDRQYRRIKPLHRDSEKIIIKFSK